LEQADARTKFEIVFSGRDGGLPPANEPGTVARRGEAATSGAMVMAMLIAQQRRAMIVL
jgi:hypothetical protein